MKTNIIIIVIIILILIYFIFKVYILENIEKIDNMGIYMSKNELEEYLIKDVDNYYKNFSDKDLKVRNVNNLEDYHEKIKKSCMEIDNNYKNILNKCINEANKKLSKYSCTGFDGKKCADTEWRIGLIKDKMYEEGYPHTRHNIIIIPSYLIKNKSQLINTLIHEKIHVYQKMYPEDINKYLEANGFTKYKLRSSFNNTGINTRSNPDMDEWIYKNKSGDIMMTEYLENAKSIMDVKTIPINSSKYEHPFEFMAYDITNNL